MTASALKKLPIDVQEIHYITPIKPLELPEINPIVSPVELVPPQALYQRSISSPGPCWDLVGAEPLAQGPVIRMALYRFNAAKAEAEDALSKPTWSRLNAWRTGNSPLPPRPPQAEEAIWPQPCRNGVTYI